MLAMKMIVDGENFTSIALADELIKGTNLKNVVKFCVPT